MGRMEIDSKLKKDWANISQSFPNVSEKILGNYYALLSLTTESLSLLLLVVLNESVLLQKPWVLILAHF